MALSKIGLNLTGLRNISMPNFGLNTTDVNTLINEIPDKANNVTNGFLGGFVIFTIFSYLYYKLSSINVSGFFRYSKIRSLSISSGISGIIGVCMVNMGYFTKLYPHILLLIIFMISFIWVIKEEN